MAFQFSWPEFDSEFYDEARSQLELALNKGNKPKNIVDHISVTELNMGTIPPDLEILEIGELSTDKFRGIFKLTYCGDAYIVIQTKVQANPMHAKESDLPRHTRPSVLAADQPLIVPMLLRISDLKLRGIVVLVVSKTKGITLVFKNDPLESIIVSSTFDSVTSVRNFLQKEIENQLRNLFQEDLPVMIHNLSLRYIQLEQDKANKQQKQEWIDSRKILQEKKKHQNTGTRTIFSDPGIQTKNSSSGSNSSILQQLNNKDNSFDTFSMPDLSPPVNIYSQISSPRFSGVYSPLLNQCSFSSLDYTTSHHQPSFSSFSDLYFTKNPVENNTINDTQLSSHHSQTVPITAANLSTLNTLYSSRFAALKTPPYSEHNNQQHNYFDNSSDYEIEDYSSLPNDTSSATNSLVAQELYANDVDAPWYLTEGLELPGLNNIKKVPAVMEMGQDIVLDPNENTVAAKLAQLASNNHTISPFAHTIQHSTFRSLPHTIKVIESSKAKNKKQPKRRIIRWNTTV